MSTQLDTETRDTTDAPDAWPPLAHIHRPSQGKLKEGKLALCGAKLLGIELDSASKVCAKCVKIAERLNQS